jgi:hypothetical protein
VGCGAWTTSIRSHGRPSRRGAPGRKLALPEAANGRVKALRQLFKWAKTKGYARTDPALEVTYLESDSDGYHTWTIDQVRQYEAHHPVGTQARLALALCCLRVSAGLTLCALDHRWSTLT